MTDLKIEFRTPTNHRGKNELSSVCQLNVIKGEEIPQLGECPPVIGIADEECKFGLSYTLEGQPQSLLEVCVIKDGKELTIGKYRLSQPVLAKIMLENRRIISILIGKDIDLNMNDDQINLSVINPTRGKSVYTVVLRNAQGEVRKDITVNILGIYL